MALQRIVEVVGRGVYVRGTDIDTDRIIPGRFLKCVTFDGLGAHLFHDARFNDDGTRKPHPLNEPRFEGATVLLSDSNFGCGSSREHAPQALVKSGFRAIVAESFAEIFFGNATNLGIPCVSVRREAVSALAATIDATPETPLAIDLETQTVSAGNVVFPFALKPAARNALMLGQWDPIGQLLGSTDKISAVAARLPYLHF